MKVAADRFDSRMQTLPREDFPTLPEGTGSLQRVAAARRPEADGREDAVRDHGRGHAVFPERRALHPSAGLDEPGFDRWAPPGAHHRAAREERREERRTTKFA